MRNSDRIFLSTKTAPALKRIVAEAVHSFCLPQSWMAPKTNSTCELVQHINDLCNEWGLVVDLEGNLCKEPNDTGVDA